MSKRHVASTTAVAQSDASSAEGADASSTSTIISKALKKNGRWDKDSFPEFMLVLYWIRQFVGVSCGLACGVFNITGVYGFALFVAANVLGPFSYYRHYANINIDDFGPNEVLSEGFQPSFGIFCLVWVIVYTTLHATV